MPPLRCGLALLLLVSAAPSQTVVNNEALEKQQQELSKRVTILRSNFATFWYTAYPDGAPFFMQNHQAERDAMSSPGPRAKEWSLGMLPAARSYLWEHSFHFPSLREALPLPASHARQLEHRHLEFLFRLL